MYNLIFLFWGFLFLTPFISAQDLDTLIDLRDNNSYTIVEIGDQVWMQENLRYQHASAYYQSKKKRKIRKFGQFYTNAALQELCPDGYSIPTRTDWDALFFELSVIRNINTDSITSKILEKDTNTEEDYVTYIMEDKSAKLDLFGPPLLLNDYGWIQDRKRNKKLGTANLWVIDDIDNNPNYHYHIFGHKVNKHSHKHHVIDTPDRIRYFNVRCIKKD